jgi:hypothetical protein
MTVVLVIEHPFIITFVFYVSANIVLNMEPMTLLLWSALQILLICWSTR